ncbi:hypothetical protein ACFL3F_01075 [Planctomycetota bacterium]
MACESDSEKKGQVTLQVNGHNIELNDFVICMFTETVLGMLRSLRGIDEVKTVSLEIVR